MIILVGGAPGVGKSIVAYQLARELALLRLIDLDILRDVLRMQSREKDDPILFRNALNAWELHGDFSPKTVLDGFDAHIRPLTGIAFRLVDSYLSTGKSAIFHGAALVPGRMARYHQRGVLSVVLAARSEAAYRNRFIDKHRMRTGRDPAEVRIKAGWILHQNIVAEAEACGLQVVDAESPADAVNALMRRISS